MTGFPNLLNNAESSTSVQMRLLLAKQGSSLPLYLHLVTDYLRLFTLYEQVSCSYLQSYRISHGCWPFWTPFLIPAYPCSLAVVMIKHPATSSLGRKALFGFGSQLEFIACCCRVVKVAGAWSNWSHCICCQERKSS